MATTTDMFKKAAQILTLTLPLCAPFSAVACGDNVPSLAIVNGKMEMHVHGWTFAQNETFNPWKCPAPLDKTVLRHAEEICNPSPKAVVTVNLPQEIMDMSNGDFQKAVRELCASIVARHGTEGQFHYSVRNVLTGSSYTK